MKAVPWLWYEKERHKRTFVLIDVCIPANAIQGRGLEKLKAMRMVYISNSFLCQQGGTTAAKCLHPGQALVQIMHLLSFLSSQLCWRQKLFLQISHKWHRPAQLIIIQAPWLSWLIGIRVHWSIFLRISSEAAVPPSSLRSVCWAMGDQ